MKPIKAFLCYRENTGDWTTSAFRDLEPLLGAWEGIREAGRSGAVAHVGFWRPDTPAMAEIAERYPRMLVLSEAAAYAIPGPVALSPNVIGRIADLPFRLVLSGFGYEVAQSPETQVEPVAEEEAARNDSRGWVADLAAMDPVLAHAVASVGIWDDESYAEREVALPYEVRQKLGVARFVLLTGSQPDADNIIDNIRACPAWFRSIRLHQLQLTVRHANVFLAHGLATVEDVGLVGTSGLFKLNNMGRKSVNELSVALYRSMLDGPVRPLIDLSTSSDSLEGRGGSKVFDTVTLDGATSKPSGIRDAIVDAAQILKFNDRGVLAARMGFGCSRLTLQEISDAIGVSRERVRQMEVRICKALRTQNLWIEMERRLYVHLSGRRMPLMLDGLSAIDPWFEGLAELRGPLEFIFDRLLDGRLHVLDLDGTVCVSRLSQNEWESNLRAAKKLLEGSAPDRLSEADARHLVESLLVGPGEELRGDLWSLASKAARFADSPDGTRRLVAYGKSADAVVHAILSGSPTPLHYTDIHRLALEEADSTLDVRRIHSAAASVGVLFARGTYGLPHHSPLSAREMEVVRAEAEDLMYGDAPDRQWHCMEICDALVERGLGFDERLSKYVVNLALKDAPRLANLGRLVWGLAESWRARTSSRIDVRQAVIALLEREGRPLTTGEIRRLLEAERGVNVHFQIHPEDPLVRVGPGEWGLIHRDLGLGSDDAKDILVRLRDRLGALGKGIHLSEVASELNLGWSRASVCELSPYWIFTLAKRSGMRVDRGQYLYLQEWENSRRMSIQDSVQAALAESGIAGATVDEIWTRANEISSRQCSKLTIRQALQTVGAVFHHSTGLWTLSESAAQADAGEDLA